MQPYLFPYLGYFQLIDSVDRFVVYDDVNYIKQGWINRNNILLNDKAFMFNIPLNGASSFKKINETEVDNRVNWRKKLMQTFSHAYSKAPNYKRVYPIIENTINCKSDFISDVCLSGIINVCEYLSIKTLIRTSSVIYNNQNLQSSDRVIDICKKEEATIYINAIGGMKLYDKNIFLENGLDLKFISSGKINYKQYNNDFVSSLSIIDLLMFNTREDCEILLKNYSII